MAYTPKILKHSSYKDFVIWQTMPDIQDAAVNTTGRFLVS